jgi:hypothetical protein
VLDPGLTEINALSVAVRGAATMNIHPPFAVHGLQLQFTAIIGRSAKTSEAVHFLHARPDQGVDGIDGSERGEPGS